MKQDEIIEMARQVARQPDRIYAPDEKEFLYYFSKLIAAKEREACSDLIHELAFSPAMFATMDEWRGYKSGVNAYLDAIRARGEA